jgi:cyclophilin family peptidyl-prolyl cis-trans isomerase
MPSAKAAKRARQKAGRKARMVELQKAQQRRSRIRRSLVGLLVVLIAVGLAYYTVGRGGSKKASSSTTTTKASTTYAGLAVHSAPAISPDCNTPASGPAGPGATPGSGHAVSIVPAPSHVPFPSWQGNTLPAPSSPRYTRFSSAPPFCIDASKSYLATVNTDAGSFNILLLPKYAPVTVNNFIFLAGYHYFDGIYFHRVVTGFVDQVGDPTGTGNGGPGYTIPDEYPASTAAFSTGAVAMANTGQPHSGGSQWFVFVGSSWPGTSSYAVFGRIQSGMNVVQKINSDGSSSETGTPAVWHRILSVTITRS